MKTYASPRDTKGLSEAPLELPKAWTPIGSGKVRTLYRNKEQGYLLSVTTDKISAFDVVLRQPIPYKGAVLNLLNARFLEDAKQRMPQWMISCPFPQLMIGKYAEPLAVECIIRAHLSGHAWRTYRSGERMLYNLQLPEGLFEHAPLAQPIFTPSTKAKQGQSDEYLSPELLLEQTNIKATQLQQLEAYAQQLFKAGSEHAQQHGLRLMDAKYEFGLYKGVIHLIDELHTPDAARYCREEDYQHYLEERRRGKKVHLEHQSKEALRAYLLEKQQAGATPTLSEHEIHKLSALYLRVFEQLTGKRLKQHAYTTDLSILQEQALKAIHAIDA